MSFYAPIGDPGKPKNVHSNVSVTYPGGITNTSTVGGPFIDFGSQDVLIDSSPVYLRLEFDDDVSEGDLVGVTLLFDDGSRARYFVQPFGEGALIS